MVGAGCALPRLDHVCPHSLEGADVEVRRVTEDLTPYVTEGWVDDTFMQPFTRPGRARWRRSGRALVEGCAVKLQRPNGSG